MNPPNQRVDSIVILGGGSAGRGRSVTPDFDIGLGTLLAMAEAQDKAKAQDAAMPPLGSVKTTTRSVRASP